MKRQREVKIVEDKGDKGGNGYQGVYDQTPQKHLHRCTFKKSAPKARKPSTNILRVDVKLNKNMWSKRI